MPLVEKNFEGMWQLLVSMFIQGVGERSAECHCICSAH